MEYIRINKEDLASLLSTADKEGKLLDVDVLFEIADDWGLVSEEKQEGNYEMFAKIYLAFRRKLKHRGMSLITSTSGQWHTLKRVVTEVEVFAEEHNISFRKAATRFLATANMISKSMKLHDIELRVDRIHEAYLLATLIESDENKKLTSDIYEEYKNQSYARTGNFDEDGILGDDRKFIHFVDAAQIAKENKISGVEYVQRLCDYYDWLGFMPVNNLDGPKAAEIAKDMKFQKHGKEKVVRVNLKNITQQNRRKHD